MVDTSDHNLASCSECHKKAMKATNSGQQSEERPRLVCIVDCDKLSFELAVAQSIIKSCLVICKHTIK